MAGDPGGGQSDTIEVEWQFDALDLRPVGRWLAGLATGTVSFPLLGAVRALARPMIIQHDTYYDTEDWRIGQAGYVLRVRNAKDKQEATLKALERATAGRAAPKRRREVNEAVDRSSGRWLEETGPVGWRVAALVGRRPLHHVLEVQTRRRPFVLHVGEEDVAEVALDETAIAIDDQNPMRLLRVEVEVDAQWEEALTPLVDDLRRSAGLTPATLSKFEAGVLARGYVIPSRVDLGPTAVSSTSSIGEVADAVIRKHLGALLTHEAGTRLGEDVEELHDMRVATRRLRAAMGLFGEVLPPQFGVLEPELKWLADILGAVRDLDVQLERIDSAPEWHGPWSAPGTAGSPLEELRGVIEREREGARAVLLQALESARYERLSTGLLALAQQGAGRRSATGQLPASSIAPDLLVRRHRAAMKAARRARRSGAAPDFHRLRIRCKRLRYAAEFVADLYGEPATEYAKKIAGLQDLLGTLQDDQVAMERLHALATRVQPPLTRATVFLMGAVAQEARHDSDGLLAGARRKLDVLSGEQWHRLAHRIEAMRMAGAPVETSAPPTAPPTPAAADPRPSPALGPGRLPLGAARNTPPELS